MIRNKDQIQTRIQVYEKPSSGTRVTLVGAIHAVTEAKYYPVLQNIIDDRHEAGAAVHFEGVRMPSAEELQVVSPKLVARAHQMRLIPKSVPDITAGLPFYYQGKEMHFRETWQNKDLNYVEIAASMSRLALAGIAFALPRAVSYTAENSSPEERLTMLFSLPCKEDEEQSRGYRYGKAFGQWAGSKVTSLLLGESVLHRRNEHALREYDRLQETETGREAVLLWGEAHLTGLGEGLEQRGFMQMDERRVTAVDIAALREKFNL